MDCASDALKTRVVQLKCMLIMGIYVYVYSVPCYLDGLIRDISHMDGSIDWQAASLPDQSL